MNREDGLETAGDPSAVDAGEPTLEGCFAPDGTDLTLIAKALEMTPTQRLQTLQGMVDFAAAARRLHED